MALSFPCAWMVDRISPYKLAALSLGFNAILFWILMRVDSAHGLIVVAFMFVVAAAFNGVASMMVFRSAHPAEVGSVTSSLALVNNAFNATLTLVSGQLIERLGHNYKAAFLLGIGLSAFGYGLLLYYRHLMKSGRRAGLASIAVETVQERTTS